MKGKEQRPIRASAVIVALPFPCPRAATRQQIRPTRPCHLQGEAERLQQSALEDTVLHRYASAYRKILAASLLESASPQTAVLRSRIATLYRRRLQRCIYAILFPWLLFLCAVKVMAVPLDRAGLMYCLFACLAAIGAALCLHAKKERVD